MTFERFFLDFKVKSFAPPPDDGFFEAGELSTSHEKEVMADIAFLIRSEIPLILEERIIQAVNFQSDLSGFNVTWKVSG